MTKLTIGPWLVAQKLPNPTLARDRAAFLERTKRRADVRSVAGYPLLGTGGSCGKPAFALPYTITWDDTNTQALEAVAREFDCFVEYGFYPHLKLNDGEQEVAAVQDWSAFGTVYLRPGYDRAAELLGRLGEALTPQTSRS